MKAAFFILLFAAWIWAHWYVWRRVSSVFRMNRVGKFVSAALLALLAVAWPVARSLQRLGDTTAVQVFQDAGAIWMGFICVLLLALIAVDIVVLMPVWIGVRRRAVSSAVQVLARRASLALATIVAVVVTFSAYAVARGPVTVNVQEIQVPGLPAKLDGTRLLFLSDVHQGGLIGIADIDRIEKAVLSSDFDLIMFGGDLTDQEDGDGPSFRRMTQWAQYSSIGLALAVTGNHDRYSGGEAVVSGMKNMGMIVLRQEHICLPDGLCVAGVDDPAMLPEGTSSDAAVVRAMAGMPGDSFVILLSHQPTNAGLAASLGVDLMLSGHTHHGQFPPATFFTPLFYRYWAGLYRVQDMSLYVTSGAGFWGPPLRLGSRPEVVKIVIRQAKSQQQ